MPRGRPRIQLDKRQFESLCQLQCTREEIAGFFDCSEDTVERWCVREYSENFAAVFAKSVSVAKYPFAARSSDWPRNLQLWQFGSGNSTSGNTMMTSWLLHLYQMECLKRS